jgi:hypothetical protein
VLGRCGRPWRAFDDTTFPSGVADGAVTVLEEYHLAATPAEKPAAPLYVWLWNSGVRGCSGNHELPGVLAQPGVRAAVRPSCVGALFRPGDELDLRRPAALAVGDDVIESLHSGSDDIVLSILP